MSIDQIIIAIFSTAGIWMSQSDSLLFQKWACVVALIAQPFWIYTAIRHKQIGVLIVALVSTAAWGRGLFTYWVNV